MTNDDVLKALGKVQEPDLGKDLVTLNMVRDIDINGNNISFTVVLRIIGAILRKRHTGSK